MAMLGALLVASSPAVAEETVSFPSTAAKVLLYPGDNSHRPHGFSGRR